ncbi:PP2C family protein-serine/threonine phosphatase [Streptomyces sp. HNM0574]|uniref:PP2C family protein-serine/threonine phosphatase n=1 Tax=Streptomyces sp. HNM0574 TaxID=2714954 RepID=UPI003217C70A
MAPRRRRVIGYEPLAAPLVRGLTRWLPAGLIGIGIGSVFLSDYHLTGTPFFAAAPLAAAPFSSALRTGLIGLLSVCVLCVILVSDAHHSAGRGFTLAATVTAVAGLALGINFLTRRGGDALASARTIAEAAQFAVLPVPPSRLGGLDIAARYRAAETGAHIGGDLYAVQDTPHGVRMIVGDVRGKGMDAVEAVVIVIGAFREAAEQESTLEAVAGRLERALRREGERRQGLDHFEGFTTAALAEIPAGRPQTLRFVNRGHPAPLLLADGVARFCVPSQPALPLGMPDLGHWPDHADEVPFPYGAQLLLYTDGLSEARNHAGDFYEPDKRLSGSVFAGPDELLDEIVVDVDRHTGGGTGDDMALLAVQHRGPERRPGR